MRTKTRPPETATGAPSIFEAPSTARLRDQLGLADAEPEDAQDAVDGVAVAVLVAGVLAVLALEERDHVVLDGERREAERRPAHALHRAALGVRGRGRSRAVAPSAWTTPLERSRSVTTVSVGVAVAVAVDAVDRLAERVGARRRAGDEAVERHRALRLHRVGDARVADAGADGRDCRCSPGAAAAGRTAATARATTSGPPLATSAPMSNSSPQAPVVHSVPFGHSIDGIVDARVRAGAALAVEVARAALPVVVAADAGAVAARDADVVYGASTEPKTVTTLGSTTVGSSCGSRIGGSLPPSGVNEVRNTWSGTASGSGDSRRARMRRGTGRPWSLVSTPCHTIGSSRLPSASTRGAQLGRGRGARRRVLEAVGLRSCSASGSAVKCGKTSLRARACRTRRR